MNRIALILGSVGLMTCGALTVGYYGSSVRSAASTDAVRDLAILLGLGVSLAAGGVLLLAAAIRRITTVALPPVSLSVVVGVAGVAAGSILVWQDIATEGEPIFAILGVLATASVILRIATRWSAGRRAPSASVLIPAVWGMLGATTIAVVLQLTFAVSIASGIAFGVWTADSEMPRRFIDLVSQEGFIEDFGGDLIATPTVAFAMFAIYGIAAPLTEELAKLIGVILGLRRRVRSAYAVLVAGVAAGVGFAAVETLAFALSSGASWPILVALRAPVALIHVTASVLAAYGWYRQSVGGVGGTRMFATYFGAGVLVHAAWNSSIVAIVLISVTADMTAIDGASAMALLLLLGGMVTLLVGCAVWFFRIARELGRRTPMLENNGHQWSLDPSVPVVGLRE